mgnify:FL=1
MERDCENELSELNQSKTLASIILVQVNIPDGFTSAVR